MARYEAFWRVACDNEGLVWAGFVVVVFLLVLSVLAVTLAPPDSASFYIAVVDLGMVLVLGAVVAGVALVCRRRRQEPF